MRILFLSQVLPYPLDAGPKIRAYYTLRYLARRHRVTLLSFVRPTDGPMAVDHLRSFCDAVHLVPMRRSRVRDAWHLSRSLLSPTPFLIARDHAPAMARCLRSLLAATAFDAVHADQLWMAPYARQAAQQVKGKQGIITVLDQHNAVFQIPRRMAQHAGHPLKRRLLDQEARKLLAYEAQVCQEFDQVVWVTRDDEAALRDSAAAYARPAQATRDTTIIPICTDPREQPVIQRKPHAHRVTFLGGLHWPPNAEGVTWFATQVWPSIEAARPEATLTVIGKNPPAALLAPASRRLEVTGYVEDPSPYLAETAVFVVPLHAGGGMRVKILDAWRWGLPVVATPIGAEGLAMRDGENGLLAATPQAFAEAVVRVLTEPELARRLARAGRATVEAEYDWQTVYQAWDRVYSPDEHSVYRPAYA